MLENMQKIEKAIKEKFPECEVDIDGGDSPGNYWFLNAWITKENHVAIEWSPKNGFDLIANREVIYCESGDEFFDHDLEKTIERTLELLENKEPTCHKSKNL